jgi:hypothetical protein
MAVLVVRRGGQVRPIERRLIIVVWHGARSFILAGGRVREFR